MAAGRKRVEFVEKGVNEATDQIDAWLKRGIPEAVEDGLREYAEDVTAGAYRRMRLPSTGKRDPLSVGLRYRKTRNSFAGPYLSNSEPDTWLVKLQPQYIAHWQEWGTAPHDLVGNVNPKDRIKKKFAANEKRLKRDIEKFHKYKAEGDTKGQRRVGKRVWARYEDRDRLRAELSTAVNGLVGYAADQPFRPGRGNRGSDWLQRNDRPATVVPGRKFWHGGTRANYLLAHEAEALMLRKSHAMAQRLTDAYQRRRKGR